MAKKKSTTKKKETAKAEPKADNLPKVEDQPKVEELPGAEEVVEQPEPETPVEETVQDVDIRELALALYELYGVYTIFVDKEPDMNDINPVTGVPFNRHAAGVAYQLRKRYLPTVRTKFYGEEVHSGRETETERLARIAKKKAVKVENNGFNRPLNPATARVHTPHVVNPNQNTTQDFPVNVQPSTTIATDQSAPAYAPPVDLGVQAAETSNEPQEFPS